MRTLTSRARAVLVVAAMVLGGVAARIVADLAVAGRSAATRMFVETLVVMFVYGALAWWMLATLQQRRSATSATATQLPLHGVDPVVVSGGARHLRLVPTVSHHSR